MSKRFVIGVLMTMLLAAPLAVRAHEGHAHKVMGTVVARQDSSIQLKRPDGKIVTVVLNEKTTFTRGRQKVGGASVKVGERMVVEIVGEKDMTAKAVTLAAAAPATARK